MGTGYAAKVRAEAFKTDPRSTVIAIAGHTPDKTAQLSQTVEADAVDQWQHLVERPDIDVVVISTINRDHEAIARAALNANKHVVMEYPLALNAQAADSLIELAIAQNRLLHVEHIELLSGIHTAAQEALPKIGTPSYVRYSNINPQQPAPLKWTYHPDLFGFPLIGALSRVSRLTDLFGAVAQVSCQERYWDSDETGAYRACLCSAQLTFTSGLVADLVYGKGEAFWKGDRILVIEGTQGAVVIDGEDGQLIGPEGAVPLTVGSRRGLFARDTAMVLDHLTQGTPLYTTPHASLYALRIAEAAHQAAQTNTIVSIPT